MGLTELINFIEEIFSNPSVWTGTGFRRPRRGSCRVDPWTKSAAIRSQPGSWCRWQPRRRSSQRRRAVGQAAQLSLSCSNPSARRGRPLRKVY